MRRAFLLMGVVLCFGTCAGESGEAWGGGALAPATADFDRFYAGASATLVLPQGGARLHRLGGASAHFGYYVTEALALDGEAAWVENKAGLAARALWHFRGWEIWNKYFGYERFDPFVTVGAKGYLDHGQVGPAVGLGALYYLTETWALRFDADLTLGLDAAVETVPSLSLGLQYSF